MVIKASGSPDWGSPKNPYGLNYIGLQSFGGNYPSIAYQVSLLKDKPYHMTVGMACRPGYPMPLSSQVSLRDPNNIEMPLSAKNISDWPKYLSSNWMDVIFKFTAEINGTYHIVFKNLTPGADSTLFLAGAFLTQY